ncbi:fluoride efflux transporter CrcB [Microcoleus sp. FACHB-1515]|uniref:fluoride efflux transporter CrcB n=1 Tax=Cyanophyceae TaxID=3028117 RepID=UPI0028C44832|nr:fluoride efflux transporter CrcB [Microcoleus sp. FACHB-1515]
MRAAVAISLGAIAGALSRYFVAIALQNWLGASFPFGTLFVNLSGAFAMGWFSGLAIAPRSPELRLLLAVGFLGSYTTFSTYELDVANLLALKQWQAAVLYWLGSAILGIGALVGGRLVAAKKSQN